MSIKPTHDINLKRITQEEIDEMKKSVEKYLKIQSNRFGGKKEEEILINIFKEFYLVPKNSQRHILNKEEFFKIIRQHKFRDPISLNNELRSRGVIKQNGNLLSFCSKAIHTYNTEMPIYDSHVCEYIKYKNKKYFKSGNDIQSEYKDLEDWYKTFLKDKKTSNEWIKWFNDNVSKDKSISDVKKIDFILYKLSYGNTKKLNQFAQEYITKLLQNIYFTLSDDEANVFIRKEGISCKKQGFKEISKDLNIALNIAENLYKSATTKMSGVTIFN